MSPALYPAGWQAALLKYSKKPALGHFSIHRLSEMSIHCDLFNFPELVFGKTVETGHSSKNVQ
jgi:hypothetical protein